MRRVGALLLLLFITVPCYSFIFPVRKSSTGVHARFSKLRASETNDQYSALQQKLIQSKAASDSSTVSKTEATTSSQASATVTTKLVEPKQANAPAGLSPGEYFAGVGLGLLPYAAGVAILLGALKSFPPKRDATQSNKQGPKAIATPTANKQTSKPLSKQQQSVPVPPPTNPTKVYDKSLLEGAKEGIQEFFQGKRSSDIEVGLKLMLGSLSVAVISAGLLFVTREEPELPVQVSLSLSQH